MMSILGFREQTLDPIITAHTAGEGGKKEKRARNWVLHPSTRPHAVLLAFAVC